MKKRLVVERAAQSEGEWLPVATPEDVIILKLIAGRPNDWRDAHNLGLHNPIDRPYVEHWAEVWQVTERLDRLKPGLTAED